MKKIILFLTICTVIFAEPRPTQDDFNSCFEKNKKSIVSVNGNFGVALTPSLIAATSNVGVEINDYIKFDPYLGLYLVKSNQTLTPAIMTDENNETKIDKTSWVGALNDSNNTRMGHIKSYGFGLGDFDKLNFDVNLTTELNTACCQMVGITVGGNKFIPNRYLRHFAKYNDVYYGDIGVIFEQKRDGKIFVSTVDPLGRGRVLLVGDRVLSVNSKAPTSLRDINEMILFAPKTAILNFKVLRGSNELEYKIPVSGEIQLINKKIDESQSAISKLFENMPKKTDKKKFNSNNFSNNIFEKWGIIINKNLTVKQVIPESNASKFGIMTGDKILQVDKKIVENNNEMIHAIGKQSEFLLLFRRDEFDFFARVHK